MQHVTTLKFVAEVRTRSPDRMQQELMCARRPRRVQRHSCGRIHRLEKRVGKILHLQSFSQHPNMNSLEHDGEAFVFDAFQ